MSFVAIAKVEQVGGVVRCASVGQDFSRSPAEGDSVRGLGDRSTGRVNGMPRRANDIIRLVESCSR
ncbi:hypothetical protein AB0F52_09335 [Amycolatopsis sp. NPDC024027]|uniref:hypothetical protein n=1 Tax=Amycolatopsis sp. NPDC024027 TaxID=3154327 RepID=UPI0033CB23FB